MKTMTAQDLPGITAPQVQASDAPFGTREVHDSFDAALARHAHLLATAPIVRHRNELLAVKWGIVRLLAQRGPLTASTLTQHARGNGQAALDALLKEGLIHVGNSSDDPRSITVSLTARGKTVFDTIRPAP